MTRSRLAILATHVIQYQDPLFKRIAQCPRIEQTVFFCSRRGAESYHDPGMSVDVAWDLQMLQGYRHVFLRNLAPDLFGGSFFRAVNPGIVARVQRERFDAVLVMSGWGTATSWMTFAACLATGTPYLVYGDSSFIPVPRGPRGWLHRVVLRKLFSRAGGFMITGSMNADYYRHFGADKARFFAMPWAVDNDRFLTGSRLTVDERRDLRARFGIPGNAFVILFSGKLIPRKNPHHLLEAVSRMNPGADVRVVFMGDGVERSALEAFAASDRLAGRVVFTGFINQREIPRIYAMCDVLAFPSSFDPRGTVTNEAMACGLPVIVSDRVGVYGEGDIVRDGETGFVFPVGDRDRLAALLELLRGNPELRQRMGRRAREVITSWSYERDVEGLLEGLDSIAGLRTTTGSWRASQRARGEG